MSHFFSVFLLIFSLLPFHAQNECYWQQHVAYTMYIDMDVESYKYSGTQQLIYTNNSPDTLEKVFYHLYFNAFQPGSDMDERSRSIQDPDSRVKDRISKLKPNEIGFINVNLLTQDGVKLHHETVGTVLEVSLNKPVLSGQKTTFYMEFEAQVPVQIRRSGRNNKEGIALSMAQWYPKIAEYDYEGWHADSYIGREFHGVWGNFDVTINIDKDYILGSTGYLQNPNEVGHGYETGKVDKPPGNKLKWHFLAPEVHDFTWAADPGFKHDIVKIPNGPDLHFLYKRSLKTKYRKNWKKLQPAAAKALQYFSETIGPYPYKQYSVIQGGDGGMEYGMCTLITGERKFNSLLGVTVHEIAHAWFQFLLATNEAKHYWMDEGFTSYIENLALAKITGSSRKNLFKREYDSYLELAKSGVEQPMTTHADRFAFNFSYGRAAYSKGAVFLAQLAYIIGEENLQHTIKRYYDQYAYKHPTPLNFIRIAEKISKIELDWYLTDWTQTTNTIDYGIESITEKKGQTVIILKRNGLMPMPVEVEVAYLDGKKELYYIPLEMMRGEKPVASNVIKLKDWSWAKPLYEFSVSTDKEMIKMVTIDPKNQVADLYKGNNSK